tara:strand:+ start:1661 stop:3499 length:1839 start_codon:yes stop_codon:yes gene_type:complete
MSSRSRYKSETNEYKIIQKLYQGNDGPVFLIKDKRKGKKGQELVLKRYEFNQLKYGVDSQLLVECIILNLIKEGQKSDNLLQMDRIITNDDLTETDIFVEKLEGELIKIILAEPNIKQVKNIMKQILNGLLFLHSHGIIHNDIKPKNILFIDNVKQNASANEKDRANRYTIKIIDFGLAYFINFPYYRARRIQTTHHYTPPEYMDHREIGKVSVNSDIFSLGIIFYYLINLEGYKIGDYNRDYDLIFDPRQVDWETVETKAGKDGVDLLRQMLELNPDDRISSIRALDHPFLKNIKITKTDESNKQKGGGGTLFQAFTTFSKEDCTDIDCSRINVSGLNSICCKEKNKCQQPLFNMVGGSSDERRWEITSLMSKNEYLNRKNADEFLDIMVKKSISTTIEVEPKQKLPDWIWNTMYSIFSEYNLKFITLNYAIFLMLSYNTKYRVRQDKWELLAFASLILSSKVNEYESGIIRISSYSRETRRGILEMEAELIDIFDWNLPIPQILTKEIILYERFLQIIYEGKAPGLLADPVKFANFYHIYYILELLSSLAYFDEKLIEADKEDLVNIILSFKFKIEYDQKLKEKLIDIMKRKQNVYWIERDLLKFLNIVT